MADAVPPPRTFGDLDRLNQEIEVRCQRCFERRRLTGSSLDKHDRPLRDQPIAGRRYVCACGGIGLPTIRRRWVEALSHHGRGLEARSRR